MVKKQKADWEEGDYFVQKILSSRFNSQLSKQSLIVEHVEYKVKWVGYPMDQCTWEPLVHLKNVQDMVRKFRNDQAQKLKQQKNGKSSKQQDDMPSESQQLKQSQNIEESANQINRNSKLKLIQKSTHTPLKKTKNLRSKQKQKVSNSRRDQSDKNSQKLIQNLPEQKDHQRSVLNQGDYQEDEIDKYLSNDNPMSENKLQKNLAEKQSIMPSKSNDQSLILNSPQQNSKFSEQMELNLNFPQKIQEKFEILGMSRNQMDLFFHIQENGVQKWVNRSQIIDKRAKQICEFYQRNLVFLKDTTSQFG